MSDCVSLVCRRGACERISMRMEINRDEFRNMPRFTLCRSVISAVNLITCCFYGFCRTFEPLLALPQYSPTSSSPRSRRMCRTYWTFTLSELTNWFRTLPPHRPPLPPTFGHTLLTVGLVNCSFYNFHTKSQG